jgi:hypothetical protein
MLRKGNVRSSRLITHLGRWQSKWSTHSTSEGAQKTSEGKFLVQCSVHSGSRRLLYSCSSHCFSTNLVRERSYRNGCCRNSSITSRTSNSTKVSMKSIIVFYTPHKARMRDLSMPSECSFRTCRWNLEPSCSSESHDDAMQAHLPCALPKELDGSQAPMPLLQKQTTSFRRMIRSTPSRMPRIHLK